MNGIYALTADEYHQDAVAEVPSLSASIAKLLIDASPAHAKAAHPRLTPERVREDEERFDIGNVSHQLLLEGMASVVVIDAPDWRTKAAKEERDAARDAGQTPLLLKHFEQVEKMVAAVRTQLEFVDCDPPLFVHGEAEQTIAWEESGVTCRGRVDWLHDSYLACDDLKTSSRTANPEQWCRSTLYSIGADVQAAMYVRGVEKITGVRPDFRFVVAETTPPYAISVVSLAPSAMELANAKFDYALKVWSECLERDVWPSYPTRVCWAEAPSWEQTRWMEKEARVEMAA